jgi:hypothetical protein
VRRPAPSRRAPAAPPSPPIPPGQLPEELPESLIGAVRLDGIDLTTGRDLDTSAELPLLPRKPKA